MTPTAAATNLTPTTVPATINPEPPKPVWWFELLVGGHIQDAYPERRNKLGKPVEIQYRAGDVFQSTSWLVGMNGTGGMQPKFRLLSDSEVRMRLAQNEAPQANLPPVQSAPPQAPAQPPAPTRPPFGADTIDAMTYDELRKFAEGEEIDLRGAKTKVDALKAVKAGLGIR